MKEISETSENVHLGQILNFSEKFQPSLTQFGEEICLAQTQKMRKIVQIKLIIGLVRRYRGVQKFFEGKSKARTKSTQ